MSTAATKRKALGRGLSNLIPTGPTEAEGNDGGEIHLVDTNAIDPNPYQPRKEFDENEIAGLAESIKVQGLLQPIVLRKKGIRYEIISGERRFRAFQRLRRDAVPCYVRGNVSDNDMLELALVENIQREELNEIEKAIAYKKLIEQCGYTHDVLADKMGKSRAVVTNAMRLLNLPAEVQEMVRKNQISMGHARTVLAIEGAAAQCEAARRILQEGLTVRDIENIVKAEKGGGGGVDRAKPVPAAPEAGGPEDPNVAHALEQLRYRFGTPVRLKTSGDGKGGRLEIEYFSEDDLARLFDILLDGAA
jgi:ParB family chromosome partitioning protein